MRPHEEEGPSPTEAAALGPERQGLACGWTPAVPWRLRGPAVPARGRTAAPPPPGPSWAPPDAAGLCCSSATAPGPRGGPPTALWRPGGHRGTSEPPAGAAVPPRPAPAVCAAQEPLRAKPLHNRLSLDRSAPPCEPGPQHPRPGARRSPALGRDSKHRAEAPRAHPGRHVPRSTRGQGAAGPKDGDADGVQSAPPAGTLGQRSTAPPTATQHLAGDLNGLLSEAAGTPAPGPCPPRTERSPPPAPAEPRGLPATWGQLAGEAATRLLRPRVLRSSGTSECAPGPTAGPWFSKTGGARRSPP